MCTCRTAARRRRQALNNYRHLAPLVRPRYKKRDATVADRRLKAAIEKQKMIALRKGMSKKK